MKLRIAWLAVLCLALALPGWAGTNNGCSLPFGCSPAYDNGPINGTTDAWTINFGYIVSDTFTGVSEVLSFQFAVWEFPGDTMSSVQWSVTSGENSGTLYGSGVASGMNLTDKFISTNQYGYNIDAITVSNLNVGGLNSTTTYWLNLQNAAVPSGDPVFWDENSGVGCQSTGCPSKASESSVGTIPSEAFAINESLPASTPEPSSLVLFGSGVLGLAGLLRCKLRW